MPRIFISYRRAVSAYQARALHDRLTAAFGKGSVFLDIDATPPGETFESYVLKRIEDSDVFLALLAQGTLNRIHEPDDWVRREIAYALSLPHLRVIPVRVDGFLPTAGDLPDELQPLLARNAVRLEHELFEETSDRLIRYIREAVPESKPRHANRGRLAAALAGVIVVGVIGAGFAALNLSNRGEPAPADDLIAEAALVSTETASPTPTDEPTTTRAIEPLGSSLANPVTANDQWTPQFATFDDGVEMALVPAGCFMMGSDSGNSDEQPVHEQCLESFYIDRTEVTQADFERLNGVKAEANRFDGDNRPVENITWFEARAFCDLRGARLPTEAEWEYAARGPDALVYPWGNDFVADNVVYRENSNSRTASVGSRPGGASWVGAYGLSGNVWEWVSTIYGIDNDFDYNFNESGEKLYEYPYASNDGREVNSYNETEIRALRGGSWYGVDTDMRAAARSWVTPAEGFYNGGFRCARSS